MSRNPRIDIPNTPFGFIIFAIKPYRKWMFIAIFLVMLQQLFGDLQPLVFSKIIDSANIYSVQGVGSLKNIFFWTIAYPFLILLFAATTRAIGYIFNYITVYARTGVVKILFEYLSLHSISYFNDRFSGSISRKVNFVSGNISSLMAQFVQNILSFLFSFIISIIIISTTSGSLAFAFTIGFVVLIPINLFLTRPQIILSEKMVAAGAKLSGQIIDAITNISAIQQYVRRKYEIERLDKSIKEYRDADVKSDNYREKVLVINNILAITLIGITVIWAFNLWSIGSISIGQFILVASLTSSFMRSLTFIGQNLSRLMESYGEVKEGLAEIILPYSITNKPNAKVLNTKEGQVEFDNVEFNYDDDSRKVFENLFLNVKNGEKVGVVGTSGTGKTTLIKLLLRQHDVVRGKISIDGHDIRDITQESLREHISIVPQEPMLFHRTIRENILYGKLNATEEAMIEVAKKAQAHDFIELLPKKYDSLVGERGVKLSVGQRQRIAIARAFLKDSPILVLDEATSALDSESEIAVQTALQNLMESKTVFAIAHRLSTLREMDRILVFKDGKIVEDGTHRSLLRNKEGVYTSLWSHQAGGFLKDDEE
jgi:ATP-binding cassette, subfamily B, bacterial